MKESDKDVREDLLERLRDLESDREDLNDELRVINAGRIVEISNAKNKVVAMLTK